MSELIFLDILVLICFQVWDQVKQSYPEKKLWEIGKVIGSMWRELPDDEKSHFIEEYENEKVQYNEAIRLYHSSPAYQAWLATKEKGS